jgi:hypothetical protein
VLATRVARKASFSRSAGREEGVLLAASAAQATLVVARAGTSGWRWPPRYREGRGAGGRGGDRGAKKGVDVRKGRKGLKGRPPILGLGHVPHRIAA